MLCCHARDLGEEGDAVVKSWLPVVGLVDAVLVGLGAAQDWSHNFAELLGKGGSEHADFHDLLRLYLALHGDAVVKSWLPVVGLVDAVLVGLGELGFGIERCYRFVPFRANWLRSLNSRPTFWT
jgi:hypothetical protein